MSVNLSTIMSALGTASPAATSSTNVGGTDTLGAAAGGVSGLSTSDFMKLFLAQMTNQDPTKPMDD
jgi:flagellar hook assembly protein FlgD